MKNPENELSLGERTVVALAGLALFAAFTFLWARVGMIL